MSSTNMSEFKPSVIGGEFVHDPDLFEKLYFGRIKDKNLVRGIAINLLWELQAMQRYAEALSRGLSDAEARAEGWPE